MPNNHLKQKSKKRSKRKALKAVVLSSNVKANVTCHDHYVANKIGRNDLCHNCTSYADLVIKDKPQSEKGKQRFGCQGLLKHVVSLLDAERCGLNPAEESGSINDETGGVVKAMVHLKYRTLPDCPKRRITNDEDNHQLKNVNGDDIHHSSK